MLATFAQDHILLLEHMHISLEMRAFSKILTSDCWSSGITEFHRYIYFALKSCRYDKAACDKAVRMSFSDSHVCVMSSEGTWSEFLCGVICVYGSHSDLQNSYVYSSYQRYCLLINYIWLIYYNYTLASDTATQ